MGRETEKTAKVQQRAVEPHTDISGCTMKYKDTTSLAEMLTLVFKNKYYVHYLTEVNLCLCVPAAPSLVSMKLGQQLEVKLAESVCRNRKLESLGGLWKQYGTRHIELRDSVLHPMSMHSVNKKREDEIIQLIIPRNQTYAKVTKLLSAEPRQCVHFHAMFR
jgi:hypothetical protein